MQHIFNKDAVAGCGVVHKHMGHCADQFTVLDDGTAGHECVKYRTKLFYIFLRILAFGVEKTENHQTWHLLMTIFQ